MTYRQLIVQYKSLDEISKYIDEKKRKNENTDYLRCNTIPQQEHTTTN